MFGAATTLYTLLTGNQPDKLGRSRFWWPPQGEASLSPDEHAEWKRLHAVIRRAVDENAGERFVDFRAFGGALQPARTLTTPKARTLSPYSIATIVLIVVGTGIILIRHKSGQSGPLLVATAPPEPSLHAAQQQTIPPSGVTPAQFQAPPDQAQGAGSEKPGDRRALFRESIADFDREMNSLSKWTHSYTIEFGKKADALLQELTSYSSTQFTSEKARLEALRKIDAAMDDTLSARPEFTPWTASERLLQKLDEFSNKVLDQAKSTEDRIYFFEHIKPELLDKFEKTFDGLSPGNHFIGEFQPKLKMTFTSAMKNGLDEVPPSPGSLSSGVEPPQRSAEEMFEIKAMENKIDQFRGF